jgi:hypothetical protein
MSVDVDAMSARDPADWPNLSNPVIGHQVLRFDVSLRRFCYLEAIDRDLYYASVWARFTGLGPYI